MGMLKNGSTVRTSRSKTDCRVGDFIGGGTQGEVYRATLGGQTIALKWYFPQYLTVDTGLRDRLETAMDRGAPSSSFLWPIELTESGVDGSWGYVMPLREPRFISIRQLMRGNVNISFRALATAGFELSHGFHMLHARGLCYRDINFGSPFLDRKSGEVRICDNDNVDVNRQPGAILGSPGFMAPEVVTGRGLPDAETDFHSLAVLLFFMLYRAHPLDGKRKLAIRAWDLAAQRLMYGDQPVYIFDPNDRSNEALPKSRDDSEGEAGANALIFADIYPRFLGELFARTFTAGLRNPLDRVRETEWRAAMVTLRDAVLYCASPKCHRENFYDVTMVRPGSVHTGKCWNCGTQLRLPFRMRVEKTRTVAMLNYDSVLYPHHIDPARQFDFSKPVGQVVIDGDRWGLKNLSTAKWVRRSPTKQMVDVEPGRALKLESGTEVEFGTAMGQVTL
ncbi:serine/threonine protein kinase [candidate division WOR-3 bacterium]|nr:serine/threonine protein kinase [candidate division WOR-3 bacterium]